jgi:AraC family transcriptional regulator, regulatory protein of adaptative response / DNA-3-methyladenine glycosylase II
MQALGDPDTFLPTDLGGRLAISRPGHASDPPSVAALAEEWRSWRSYATQHLWAHFENAPGKISRVTKKGVMA